VEASDFGIFKIVFQYLLGDTEENYENLRQYSRTLGHSWTWNLPNTKQE
jgi:hypothetical protein